MPGTQVTANQNVVSYLALYSVTEIC